VGGRRTARYYAGDKTNASSSLPIADCKCSCCRLDRAICDFVWLCCCNIWVSREVSNARVLLHIHCSSLIANVSIQASICTCSNCKIKNARNAQFLPIVLLLVLTSSLSLWGALEHPLSVNYKIADPMKLLSLAEPSPIQSQDKINSMQC
jgi:hypothetical protein